MSKVINLKNRRKVAERAEAKDKAAQNAVKFGRTKAEKSADARRAAKLAAHLDGHKKDT